MYLGDLRTLLPQDEDGNAKVGKRAAVQPFDVQKGKMLHAKDLGFAGDEDFGMILIENQSCGTPVL